MSSLSQSGNILSFLIEFSPHVFGSIFISMFDVRRNIMLVWTKITYILSAYISSTRTQNGYNTTPLKFCSFNFPLFLLIFTLKFTFVSVFLFYATNMFSIPNSVWSSLKIITILTACITFSI